MASVPTIVLATKADRMWTEESHDLVKSSEGRQLARDLGAVYFLETSATTGLGIETLFRAAVCMAYQNWLNKRSKSRARYLTDDLFVCINGDSRSCCFCF